MVWEQLRDNLIFPELDAKDSSEIMEKVGRVFINEGLCKESYIQALINREGEFPTGIDVDGFGIAIPHTDVSHVNEAGIGIATLKKPVKFIQMGTDDEEVETKVIVMLAVDDPKKHLSMLQNILAILQDKNVLNELANAKEKTEIIKIIKNKENE
ncbi:PTS sugar transporter subunit IIA [Terrisporobacter sp.]|uniref:PTS sugar transporter subunit IIA n=1 Tax=Terrisporobacter sp. TaxID=1965305 RepID=UPI00261060D6|nr:PTS sugar transporter subunit IIA [Terrisporobacter sp.]